MVDSQYYTPQEAAAVLSCDDEQVLHWIHSGQLPAVNVAKSANGLRPRWRISAGDLGKFLISRRNAPPAPQVQRREIKRPAQQRYV